MEAGGLMGCSLNLRLPCNLGVAASKGCVIRPPPPPPPPLICSIFYISGHLLAVPDNFDQCGFALVVSAVIS